MRNVIYTQRVEVIENYNERRDCADQRIAEFILQCGYVPIPVPNNADIAAQLIAAVKPVGIILTGGNSLECYGGNAPERDAMDRKLIEIAIKDFIPVYGFCRGMQSVLDYFGNEVINVSGHVAVRHIVDCGDEQIEVNSYHNQACISLKAECGLKVEAVAQDGIIEMVSHREYPILGTMWHPEREVGFREHDIERVRKLFG